MKKDVKKIRAILLAAGITVILALSAFLIWRFFFYEKDVTSGGDYIHYAPADYDKDILSDQVYLSYNRDLIYGTCDLEQAYSYEEDYEIATPECKFFLDYFKTVISGDYENLPKFHVDGFFKTSPKFTMQMIYEPYVIFRNTSVEGEGESEITLYEFYVEYKIAQNNGTFRTGVRSHAAVPQIYQLIKNQDDAYQIYRILDVQYVNDD